MSKPIDVTKPVQTRSGLKVRLIETNLNNRKRKLAGVLTMADGEEFVASWNVDGRAGEFGVDPLDLVQAPVPRKGWMNVYDSTSTPGIMNAVIFPTKEQADRPPRQPGRRRIACVLVDFIEGQGA